MGWDAVADVADVTVDSSLIRSPGIERATLAVLANTAITGVLGSLFWLVAPRLFDERAVAASVAASSLLIVLAFVAQLNMGTALSRYLPRSGSSQRSLLSFSYRIAIALACVFAVGVVAAGAARGGSVIRGGDLGLTIALAVSLPLWAVFALQDLALVALRRSAWLPVENGSTAVLRLILLPIAGAIGATSGVLVAWTLPIIPAIAIVNGVLYRRLLDPRTVPVPRRGPMVRYAAADLPGLTLTFVSLRLVPLFVVEMEGSAAGAHIGVPWSIVVVAALALPMISQLALAEMAHAAHDPRSVLRRLTRFVLAVFVPGAVAGALLAPKILALAGSRYADEGAPVLVWGILGLIPAALVECDLAALRFDGLMARTSAVQAARAVLLMAGVAVTTTTGHVELVGAVFTVVNTATLIATRIARHLHAVRSRRL
jgi:hypothetical protein